MVDFERLGFSGGGKQETDGFVWNSLVCRLPCRQTPRLVCAGGETQAKKERPFYVETSKVVVSELSVDVRFYVLL